MTADTLWGIVALVIMFAMGASLFVAVHQPNLTRALCAVQHGKVLNTDEVLP